MTTTTPTARLPFAGNQVSQREESDLVAEYAVLQQNKASNIKPLELRRMLVFVFRTMLLLEQDLDGSRKGVVTNMSIPSSSKQVALLLRVEL